MSPRSPGAPGRSKRKSAGQGEPPPEVPSADVERDGGAGPVSEERAGQALLELAGLIATCSVTADAQKAQLAILQALLMPKACYVAEHQPDRDALLVVSVRGRNDARITVAEPGKGPVGRAFATRTIVREQGMLVLPVLGAEGALGCLVLLAPKFDVSDTLGRTVGAQVAAAWEFARLKDDSARRSKDLQTAIAGLKSLEKNREELLSNVSHDLKNPLTTVKAYLGMLGQAKLGALSEKQANAIQVAERNADRLLKMVNDLLLISRLQSGKMQLNERPFGLKSLTSEVLVQLGALAQQSKVRVEMGRCPEVFVKGDRERMAEAIHNLVEHAIHRSPSGGKVGIMISAADGLAGLSVTDEGPLLPAEESPHVFESFHRARSTGSRSGELGLGLPIVAKIAQLHGGKVEALPGLSRGGAFRLVLPAFAAAVSLTESLPAPRRGDILLVEDDRDCREVLQEVLEAEGYRVLSTSTVTEARTRLGDGRPAMVLLDLRLSHEDGRSVLHHIRSTPGLADTAVYIISGSSEVGSLAAGVGLDRIDGFFEKPLQLQRLLDTVASVVRPARSV